MTAIEMLDLQTNVLLEWSSDVNCYSSLVCFEPLLGRRSYAECTDRYMRKRDVRLYTWEISGAVYIRVC